MVEMMAAAAPTFRLLPSARWTSWSWNICAYHCVVKPDSGNEMNIELLNENSGRNSTGI